MNQPSAFDGAPLAPGTSGPDSSALEKEVEDYGYFIGDNIRAMAVWANAHGSLCNPPK